MTTTNDTNEVAETSTINIVPVQGIFNEDFELITLIGPAGTPFLLRRAVRLTTLQLLIQRLTVVQLVKLLR
jgi:hypothetical protein